MANDPLRKKRVADGIRITGSRHPVETGRRTEVVEKKPVAKPGGKTKTSGGAPREELVIRSYTPTLAEIVPEKTPAQSGDRPRSAGRAVEERNEFSPQADHRVFHAEIMRRSSSRQHALRGVAAGMILVIGGGVALSTVFARATIRIKPKVEVATIQNVSVVFDTSISQPVSEQKAVPAEHLHFLETDTQEVSVTGTHYTETRSRGTVRITNQYSTASQRLVAQTRFMGPSGALFRLASAVVVPGAVMEKGKLVPRSVDAELIADSAGEQANLSGPVSLKIPGFQGTPKYDGFTAVAANGFSGGSRGMKKIASDADVKQAQEQVTKKVYDEIQKQIRQKIPPGLKLIDGLQEIRIAKVDTVEEGGRLLVRTVAEGDALVFREEDVITLLKQAILPQDETKAFVDNSVSLTYAVRTLNFERGRADAIMQGSVKTKQPLTGPQSEELARALTGKKQGSVREFFNARPDVVLSSISLFPPWKSALPSNPEHIRITEEASE